MFIMKNRIKTVLCLALCLMAYISAAVSIPCTVQAQGAEGGSAAEIKPSELYARSAVLMDAETGRIDFRPQQEEQRKSAADGLIKPEECVCRSSTLD